MHKFKGVTMMSVDFSVKANSKASSEEPSGIQPVLKPEGTDGSATGQSAAIHVGCNVQLAS